MWHGRIVNLLCLNTIYCSGALDWSEPAYFGEGLNRVWIDSLDCEGSEANVGDCPMSRYSWADNTEDHDEDVGVVCYNTPPPHG